jgi:selenocysteine lyase/cysteine desulfurase
VRCPCPRARITRRALGQAAVAAWLTSGMQPLARSATAAEPDSAGNRWWRSNFPALEQTVNGHPLAYLDSAATTQRPGVVLDAVLDYYRRNNANPGRTFHALARRAYEDYEGARRTLAGFLNAKDPDEVVWVRGTTEGINLVAQIAGLRLLGPRSAVQRLPVFSFVLSGSSPAAILRHLDARGIAIRAGDLSALPLLKRFGVNEAARASCYLYTQTDELDRLTAALRDLPRTYSRTHSEGT